MVEPLSLNLRVLTVKQEGVGRFRSFMVHVLQLDHIHQHPGLQEHVYKFYELSV